PFVANNVSVDVRRRRGVRVPEANLSLLDIRSDFDEKTRMQMAEVVEAEIHTGFFPRLAENLRDAVGVNCLSELVLKYERASVPSFLHPLEEFDELRPHFNLPPRLERFRRE